jgi:hypothetical protein
MRFIRNRPADLIEPVTIVNDGPDYTAFYVAVGTPLKGQAMRDGTRITRDMPFVEREGLIGGFADLTWTDNHMLTLIQPGRLSAISLFWRESDWKFVGYYGNIQAPIRHTHQGFESADYLLDVVIDPDRSWRWKDEDEWEDARVHGLMDLVLLDQVRLEGERIIAEAEKGDWPFDGSLVDWRPDAGWPIPALPDDWDQGLDYPEP